MIFFTFKLRKNLISKPADYDKLENLLPISIYENFII